jgi:hypothetical protein
MSGKSRLGKVLVGGGVLTLVAALSTAGIALATAPKKGWTYSTQPRAKVSVTFKVSATGKKVTDLDAGIAVKCKGSAGGFPSARSGGSGKVTRTGTFTVVLKLYPPGPAGQKSAGTDTVTGKFLPGGKAIGTVNTHFDGQSSSSFCRGVKRSYSATGVS